MVNKFKGKSILVTAGNTWVKLDKVRAITNIFSGRTGIRLAEYFISLGARVTLAYNPKMIHIGEKENITLRPYVTFNDLKVLMEEEIIHNKKDVVVHSAAVSDYGEKVDRLIQIPVKEEIAKALPKGAKVYIPAIDLPNKIKSDMPELTLSLQKNEKLVDLVKYWDKDVVLVKFKLEVGKTFSELCQIAEKSRAFSRAEIIVANDLLFLSNKKKKLPAAVIISEDRKTKVTERKELPEALAQEITRFL